MLVFALVALACKDQDRIQREDALKQNLVQMRRAIAAYHAEHGRYPHALGDLVPKYLPAIPVDPVAQSSEWRVTTEETVLPSSDFQATTAASEAPASVVIDVHSGAPGADRNGVPYANY
ncbi:MAG TPA: hypothetical protein VF432_33595 [Thermoanaerobaculia bacterium]